jgi:hypothetical protein
MTQTKKQLTKSEVCPDLKAGDIIEFTNQVNYKQVLIVTKADELSWHHLKGGRNSYGTLKKYMRHKDFKINNKYFWPQ